MTLEELHAEEYECYGFHKPELREEHRAVVLKAFPEAQTETAELVIDRFTVYFLGVKLNIGKARAQAELERREGCL